MVEKPPKLRATKNPAEPKLCGVLLAGSAAEAD